LRTSLLRAPLIVLLISPGSMLAQEKKLTDAERDGLAGPVKSVSALVHRTDVKWQQPGGPALIIPVWCLECEFDNQGNETKSGQTVDGTFHGQITRLVRDAEGRVIERFVTDAITGKLSRHEIDEPSKKTEENYDVDGKLDSRSIVTFGRKGEINDKLTLDAAGNVIGHLVQNEQGGGTDTEGWGWAGDGEVQSHFRQVYDPATKIEQFTSFDGTGGANLMWTMTGGKLSSFWELRDEGPQPGDNFSENVGEDTSENYACHKDGTCELSRIRYTYSESNHRSPLSAEWKDEKGNLRFAAYYDYEFDANRNWTHRNIWVWDSGLGERKLYEVDSRSISYWPQ
jgi:YD repeat-containing protein